MKMTKRTKTELLLGLGALTAAVVVTVLFTKKKTIGAIKGRCRTTISEECSQIPILGTPAFCENISGNICEGES